MFSARVGFGTFSNTAEVAVNPFKVAKRVFSVAALLMIVCIGLCGQSLNINVTEFPIPTVAGSIVTGSDGALWFTENPLNGGLTSKIGRITTTGVITEYPLSLLEQGASPSSITPGPDGALWFGLGLGVGRISTTGTVSEFAAQNGNSAAQGAGIICITAGVDGALWFTDGFRVELGRITTNGQITIFKESTTSPAIGTISGALGAITSGPDGALWFTSGWDNSIGRITTAGVITEYPLPHPSNQFGDSIAVGPDGALWFPYTHNSIGRITTTGVITEYPVGSIPFVITKGPDGAMWFTVANFPQIGRITLTGAVTMYDLPDRGNFITLGPDGALWISEYPSNKIARLQVPARAGILSHIAAGGWWSTVITLVNTAATAVPVTVALHNDDGSALSLPVTTTQQGVSQTSTTSSVTATMNPNTTMLISTGTLASTVVGWADVTSTGPIGGFAIFRSTPPTGSPSEGTVPLQSQLPSTVTLPYDNTAGFVMGVALANLSTSSASVTATMWDDGGNQLGTQTITIAGSGHTSFVLPTQLPLTAGKRGIVQFQSAASGGITGIGLRFSPFGTFTSVPTM